MVIKQMLLPIIKKQISLFLIMIVITTLSATISQVLISTYLSIKNNYSLFLNEYYCPDIFINVTPLENDSSIKEIYTIDGVEKVTCRWEYISNIKFNNRSVITTLRSYSENSFSTDFFIHDSASYEDEKINICICKQFADINNIKVGDEMEFIFPNSYLPVRVNAIVTTPETLQPYPSNDGVRLNFADFCYTFVGAKDVKQLLPKEDATKLGNSLLIKTRAGIDINTIMTSIEEKLSHHSISISSIYTKEDNSTARYYRNNIFKYLNIASMVVPIIFFVVSLLLLFLFMYQIIKSMTREIGILNALGIFKSKILLLMSSFSLLIGLIASILSLVISIFITKILYQNLYTFHCFPIGGAMNEGGLRSSISLIVIIILLMVCFLSSLITIISLRKISPKDAVINNVGQKKQIPNWLKKVSKNGHSTILIGFNSIRQNPLRFFISCFTIFSCFSLIFFATVFNFTANSGLENLRNKLVYDSMIMQNAYYDSPEANNFFTCINGLSTVEKMEPGIYSDSAKVSYNGTTTKINLMGVEQSFDMIKIMTRNNTFCSIEDDCIVLEEKTAKDLGVKINDIVEINGYSLRVNNISYSPFLKYQYTTFATMKKLAVQGIYTAFVDVNNENQFTTEVYTKITLPFIVSSNNLVGQIANDLSAVSICSTTLFWFAIIVCFIVIIVMNKISLNNSKREYSILRLLGFFSREASNTALLQTIAYFILGSSAGIPAAILLSKQILAMITNKSMTFEYNHHYSYYLLAYGVIIISLAITHLSSLYHINRWNIAKNTQSRE